MTAAAQVVFGHHGGGGAFGDQSAAFLHELREVQQAFQAHAAADIVGGILDAEIGSEFGLLIRNGLIAGPTPGQHGLRVAAAAGT